MKQIRYIIADDHQIFREGVKLVLEDDPSLKLLTREDVARLHERLMPFHRHYADKLFANLPAGARQAARLYYLGKLRFPAVVVNDDVDFQYCHEAPARQ